MQCARPLSVADLAQFVRASNGLDFRGATRQDRYDWITEHLAKLQYYRRPKAEKRIIKQFLEKTTGYSGIQLKRLISRYRRVGRLKVETTHRCTFPRRYGHREITLLAKVDLAHATLAGPATKTILQREYEKFGKLEYARLAQISVSHLYRLRQSFSYRQVARSYAVTKPTKVTIGERRKPCPKGQPGFLRVDSVHQGDGPNGEQGIYHINLVDEVTQWEAVAAVPGISDAFLKPVLEELINSLPFQVIEFHSDNGSEYINKQVAAMLNRLRIKQTKSRPRRHNDNALVECKNGSVIRKQLGYFYLRSAETAPINQWYRRYFNPYLNFHRPCAFPKVTVNAKGKETKTYPQENYATPYEKLKSLPQATEYLKPTVSFAKLDQIAYAQSDTEWAEEMQQAKVRLFQSLSVRQPIQSTAVCTV